MDSNIHKDHRQRVRKRYLADGIGSMADHNIIELLLFYGVPYKDTNCIAHELIEKFGSLSGAVDAPVEELMKINGIGENAAVLIHLVHDIAVKYNESKSNFKADVIEQENYKNVLSMKYMGETREMVYMLCVDARGRVLRTVKIANGSPDSANVSNREIIEAALRNDAKNIIIAHNHPNGFAAPSIADITATRALVPLLEAVDIILADHIIVAGDDCFSMAESKKYSQIFR